MQGDLPKIKFSPFEALLIGEKNKIIKRQPLRNTIFVTRLTKAQKTINLRELFDLKKDANHKKIQRVTKLNKNNKKKKTEKKKPVYCYEYEGRKLIVKGSEFVEFKVKPDKNEKKKCVKFRPDFKFKETLEEKIVSKFHNRRRSDVIKNDKIAEDKSKRLLIRGPDGKFLSPKESQLKSFSIYLERLCEKKVKKLTDDLKSNCDNGSKIVKKEVSNVSPNRVAKKFCEIYSPPVNSISSPAKTISTPIKTRSTPVKTGSPLVKSTPSPSRTRTPPVHIIAPTIRLPPYPENIKRSDYDDNEYLIDLIYEQHSKSKPKTPEQNGSKELKVYSKKKSVSTDIEVVYDSRLEGDKKPEEEVKKSRRLSTVEQRKRIAQNAVKWRKRNGFNSRIDEPLNIDDHLIEGTNLGTLFFNTSNGDNVFLGNFVKPLLFDSPFGSLPSV